MPLSEEAATEREREESLRALKQLRERVPLMNQHDMDAAMERLLAGGKVPPPLPPPPGVCHLLATPDAHIRTHTSEQLCARSDLMFTFR